MGVEEVYAESDRHGVLVRGKNFISSLQALPAVEPKNSNEPGL